MDLPLLLFGAVEPWPFWLDDPPVGWLYDDRVGDITVEALVIPGIDWPSDDPGEPPFDVSMPVEVPPPALVIVTEASFEAGALVAAIVEVVEVGGAVYTVVTSAGRVAAAAAPGAVVLPVTSVST